jgi:signal-transduction protein with cAMP-binding, CBS, and nucleotidyltransferase domain
METAKDMLGGKPQELITVPVGTTISETLKTMNAHRVGAVLITRDKTVVGIWTERDLMRNAVAEGFDLKTALIDDYMTRDLVSAPHTDTVYNLMDKFLGRRIRHLLIEENGEYIGLLSGGDVMKCVIHEKDAELRQLNSMVSWDYYENWKWTPEK